MNPVPNIISSSRGVAALAMLLFPVFSPGFWAMYIWGGISDDIRDTGDMATAQIQPVYWCTAIALGQY